MNTSAKCLTCLVKPSQFSCEACENPVCKSCVEHLSEDRFFYAHEKPEISKHTRFCPQCFSESVEPEIQKYEEILEKAKKVAYLPKSYKTYILVKKEAKEEVILRDRKDKGDLILQMGYIAASLGYNALVKAVVENERPKNDKNNYKKSFWHGRAYPANIDQARLELEEYRDEVFCRGF